MEENMRAIEPHHMFEQVNHDQIEDADPLNSEPLDILAPRQPFLIAQ